MTNRQDTPAAHEDLYVELMESASETGAFIIETEDGHPDIELEVEPADKPTRNKLRRSMPDGMFDGIEMPDDVDDIDEVGAEDIDMSGVSMRDMTFSEEATELWLDTIAEHCSHDYHSQGEIRNIFNSLSDDYFITAGSYLIELGEATGPVTGFRRE